MPLPRRCNCKFSRVAFVVLPLALFLLFGSAGALPLHSPPPEKKKIILDHADELRYSAKEKEGVQQLRGNVQLSHETWRMKADSAFLNERENAFEAFGDIDIDEGDSMHIDAEYLLYQGDSKYARLRYNVRMTNQSVTLYTDSLDYDRNAGFGYYFEGGALADSLNTLTSVYGEYTPATKTAVFREEVVLENSDFTLYTHHLVYNTETRIAHYFGPTTIKSDSVLIESTRGIYDTEHNRGVLLDRSIVYHEKGYSSADSMLYDKERKFAESFGNFYLHDTIDRAILQGQYGYYDEAREYAFATEHAWLTDYSQSDTLFLAADTLELVRDGDKEAQLYLAYPRARFFKSNAQGAADSIAYFSVDEIVNLYRNPVIWQDSSQLVGDSLRAHLRDDAIEKAYAWYNAKAMRQTRLENKYEQLKADSLAAFFQDNNLKRLEAYREVEAVYYALQESIGHYFGVGRTKTPVLYAYFDADTLTRAIGIGQSEGTLYPIEQVTASESELPGMVWEPTRRPQNSQEIFADSFDEAGKPKSYSPPPLSELAHYSGAARSDRAFALLSQELRRIDKEALAKQQQAIARKKAIAEEKAKMAEQLSPLIRRPRKDDPPYRPISIIDQINKSSLPWDSYFQSTSPADSVIIPFTTTRSEKPSNDALPALNESSSKKEKYPTTLPSRKERKISQ